MINGHESLEHLFCPKTVAEDPQAHCSAVMSANEAPFVVVVFLLLFLAAGWQVSQVYATTACPDCLSPK